MRVIILICLLFVGRLAIGQGQPTAVPQNTWSGKINVFAQYLQNDSGFFLPLRDTNFIPKRRGLVLIRPDSVVYVYNGARWLGIGIGGGAGVYNAGNGLTLGSAIFKLDTSIAATKNYALSLYNILNGTKLNKSDTTSILLPYLRKGDTSSMLLPYLRKSDTLSMLSKYLRKTDTVSMLLPYLRKVSLAGNLNYVQKSTGTGTMGNSQIVDDGTNVYIGSAYGGAKLSVVNTSSSVEEPAVFFNTRLNSATDPILSTYSRTVLYGGAITQDTTSTALGVGSLSSLYFQPTADQTLTVLYAGASSGITLSAVGATVESVQPMSAMATGIGLTDDGNYDNVASLYISSMRSVVYESRPQYTGTITNYYGIFIKASDYNISTITNKYGIFQQGINDTNVFNGFLNLPLLPIFADNTAAAGLPNGTVYRTSTGELRVKY